LLSQGLQLYFDYAQIEFVPTIIGYERICRHGFNRAKMLGGGRRMQISVAILTISDKGSKGERVDKSGQVIGEMVEEKLKAWVKKYEVVPDEKQTIVEKLKEMVDDRIDLILTTGGTGLSPRDVTPEATMEVIEKEVPGIEEAMRVKGLEKTPRSMLSRGIAGVSGRSLIINLPGSPKGVRESLEVVLPAIPHALDIILGRGGECGKP
jgi:molybdenum cofactor synthesis domain-containing protein